MLKQEKEKKITYFKSYTDRMLGLYNFFVRSVFFFFLICFICSSASAQKQANNWFFGDGGGMCFNTVPSRALNSKFVNGENTASISDINGNLLFYTNGEKVWNKNNAVMDNGTGLSGYGKSPVASVVIVPFDEYNNSKYYIFTTDGGKGLNDSVFAYSVVDIALNDGLGKVITKNIILFKPSFQLVAAVKHRNQRDTWVLGHLFNTDLFYAYLATPCGITDPVISKIGLQNEYLVQTLLKFSPDGKHVSVTLSRGSNQCLFDFDNTTGTLSGFKDLGGASGGYGCCFSPNSRYLYVSNGTNVKQYDVLAGSAADIIASKVNINYSDINYPDCGLSNAPDGSIYIKKPNTNLFGQIKYPNRKGLAAEYINDVFKYPSTLNNTYGVPNFIESYFDSSWKASQAKRLTFTHNRVCAGDSTVFQMINENTYPIKWLFGDEHASVNESVLKNPKHLYSKPGKYQVKLINYITCIPDTITQEIIVDSLPSIDLGKDRYMCSGNTIILAADSGYLNYHWMEKPGTSSYEVSTPGEYYLSVTNTCGQDSDTIEVKEYDIYIPNLITPNGDNKNDFFYIDGLHGEKGELNIYNSWGAKIYSNASYNNSWNAESFESAVYYYYFRFDTCPPKIGWLQVIK